MKPEGVLFLLMISVDFSYLKQFEIKSWFKIFLVYYSEVIVNISSKIYFGAVISSALFDTDSDPDQ